MAAAGTCSALSEALGEPLAGTAPQAFAWLLVEQPGPWGANALRESRLDREVGAELERRCKELGIKAVLVKGPHGPRRRCLAAWSGPGPVWLEELPLEHARGLLELDLAALAGGRRLGGTPLDGPLYLACTNAKRDACCALRGRPVAARLAALRPQHALECSHVGGHRFAANLVCLPEGLWYGRVRPEDVERIVAEHEAGRLVPELLRGRGCQPPAAQAADASVRVALRLTGIADTAPAVVGKGADGSVEVAVAGRLVSVRPTPLAPPRPVSCGDEPEEPVSWAVVSITLAPLSEKERR